MTTTTMPMPPNMWPHDDRAQANQDRAEQRGLEPCSICGRGIAPGKGWVVEVIDGGATLIIPGTGDTADPGYMGEWTLGPECGKQIPAEYRVRAATQGS